MKLTQIALISSTWFRFTETWKKN